MNLGPPPEVTTAGTPEASASQNHVAEGVCLGREGEDIEVGP